MSRSSGRTLLGFVTEHDELNRRLEKHNVALPDAVQGWQDVEAYDSVYAAYLDARKRFSELKLSRGYLSIVALSDPSAGNLSPGVSQSPTSSPSSKGKKGKAGKSLSKNGSPKGGSPNGKSGASYKYTKAPMKPHDPRGRASAAGHERYDVAMLDPGASAFLSGFGPARRYLQFLESQGYPINDVQFHRCRYKFHFGGDGECWSKWVMQLPMCIAGRFGQAQVFLLKGETPFLCGRPIIESLGIVMDFQNKKVRMDCGPWRSTTIGLHGEYLLPL